YENVLATREIYNINIANEKIFARYLDFTKTRFAAGVVTKTDVLQAEVRYSESIAQKEQAYSSMLNAQATMARLLGQNITESMDHIDASGIQLPENVDELIEITRRNNPSLMTSKYNANVAQYQINQAVSKVLPRVSATAQFTRSNYAKYNLSNPDSNTYALQVSVPIFQGGGEYASIKEQVHLSHQADYNYKEVDRQITERSISVWNNYKTSKAIIKSREEAIRAATLALEGVQEEVTIGTRTTIDLLNAEKELFDAKVSYRTAKRDYIVSIYQMLQLMGSIEGITVEG
ncbi:MAG: TolC family protein, partial [Alphaproteobacteria bacterium]